MEINKTEEETLKFWKKNKIFEQSVKKPSGEKPRGEYIFYDGPPFITGLPHYGSILPSVVKDCVPRFWTMKGFKVERVWGWDCHGLPAENQVEKELKLKNKKEVECLGVDKFVCACKDYVNNVSSQWEWYIDKIARWVDFKNSYRTMDLKFMESVIWVFKELYAKGLIYEGYRTSLHCPRCATPLSKFEVTMDAESYKDITEMSVVAKFKLIDRFNNAYLLAWTTTPWTLPGNLALAVNKSIEYVLVESNNENYILARSRVEEIFKGKEYKIIKSLIGSELVGNHYAPLFEIKSKNKNIFQIYDGDFVTTEDGTGIVHIAPNFGEDDFELGKKNDLPILNLMDENGIYTKESKEFAGRYFKDAGKEAIEKLGDKLFSKFNHTHNYPFCYRCGTQLIYRTQKAWYLDTDKIRESMLKTNEKINWVPDFFKEGRFKYNLENAPHWCLSRSRYWGSPIPVWRCEKCNEIKVVGSIKEIEKLSGKKVSDLHRPEIDDYEFKCDKCKSKMKRVPEILDCWFESGAMPYAQWHYPFEKTKEFKKIFPADFIVEYTGQLRGWFYYLHVLSNSLFNSEAFKNVMVTGVLAGNDGRKMSKLFGNYPDPKLTLEKYGGDTLRMYFLASQIVIGGDMNINERDIADTYRKNVMLLYNVLNFYSQNAKKIEAKTSKNILDKWILSRINQLCKDVSENMEKYDVPAAAKPITTFIDDLSTWYIRLNRERINENDSEALNTLKEVLEILSKIIAPFMPYVAESIWQEITQNNYKRKTKSVHLEKWPSYNEESIDENLIEEMKIVREIVSLGLKERDQNAIGLKWPLAKASISIKDSKSVKKFEDIIKEQLNVKTLKFKKTTKDLIKVELDLNLTKELEIEGYARELSRNIQAFRKEIGLNKEDKIEIIIFADNDLKDIIKAKLSFIEERTNSRIKNIDDVSMAKETFKNINEFKIKDKRGFVQILTTNR